MIDLERCVPVLLANEIRAPDVLRQAKVEPAVAPEVVKILHFAREISYGRCSPGISQCCHMLWNALEARRVADNGAAKVWLGVVRIHSGIVGKDRSFPGSRLLTHPPRLLRRPSRPTVFYSSSSMQRETPVYPALALNMPAWKCAIVGLGEDTSYFYVEQSLLAAPRMLDHVLKLAVYSLKDVYSGSSYRALPTDLSPFLWVAKSSLSFPVSVSMKPESDRWERISYPARTPFRPNPFLVDRASRGEEMTMFIVYFPELRPSLNIRSRAPCTLKAAPRVPGLYHVQLAHGALVGPCLDPWVSRPYTQVWVDR